MVAATVVGLSAGQTLGRATVDQTVTSLGASGSFDVAAQLQFYERIAEQLAGSSQAATAIEDFRSALDDLSSLSDSDIRAQFDELLDSYGEDYLEPLRAAGDVAAVRDVVSENPAAVYLQASYRLSEPGVDALLIDDPGDGSDWTAVHSVVHPVYRTTVRVADLLDIYLVDNDERIVYSASKGPDLGTSLAVGPYGGSVVARAADAAAESDDGVLTDLSSYNGVPGVPVGAAAAPVFSGEQRVGVLVVTYDGAVFTDQLASIVSASGDDDQAADLYLLGVDGTTRSDPLTYLADESGFLDASVAAGVLPATRRSTIAATGTTVLVQPGTDATVNAANDGVTAVATRPSMTGVESVNVVQGIGVDDVGWYVVSELDIATAESAVREFRSILIVGAAVFVVTLAFVAVAWANRIMRPVQIISDRLGRAAIARSRTEAVEPVAIPDTSPVEFHRLADSFSSMDTALRRQESGLREARAQRLDVLTQMLPPSLAQRIARGELESLDEVPSASVVVVVVLGLAELVHDDSAREGRLVLDDLTAEMDDVATEHGLDRVKVVGDAYFAACGHDRPYIDHASRTTSFAEQVAAAVRAASGLSAVSLDSVIGVNTGPVTVGMSGGTRLVYDVWGPTVTTAHDVARMGRPGDIIVTEATRLRLPPEVVLIPWRDGGPADDGGRLWTVSGTGHPVDANAGTEAAR